MKWKREATSLRKFKATVRMRKAWTAVFPKKPTKDMVFEALADEILRGEIDELFEITVE